MIMKEAYFFELNDNWHFGNYYSYSYFFLIQLENFSDSRGRKYILLKVYIVLASLSARINRNYLTNYLDDIFF